jgi:predicted RecA/RadA family phage recombinase
MASATPRYQPGLRVPATALSAVTAGTLVEGAVGGIQTGQDGSQAVLGMALEDAVTNQRIAVQTGGVVKLTNSAAGALTYGQRVSCAATGKIKAANAGAPANGDTNRVIGICWEPAGIAANASGLVLLTL